MSDHYARLTKALEDRYTLERELGAGGMATVYLADDLKHERKVAIKVLRPELAAVIGAERFLSEIKTTANLQHPNILPLFDSGESDGFLYYVMPFVEGQSLRSRLEHEKQLPVDEAVSIAQDVASALQYAHEHEVIHRDIKPENILLHAGKPVVADFGIALAISAAGGGRMTETGLSLGTPHYMSPEQATADRDLSARSDMYSLACVLYEMLAGDPPHAGPTSQSVLMKILTQDAQPVTELRRSVPPHVAAALSRALEKLPADRFDSAEAFAKALADTGFTHTVTRVTPAAGLAGQPAAATGPIQKHWAADPRTLIPTAAVVALLALRFLDGGAPVAHFQPTHRFLVTAPIAPGQSFDIAPDGSIVFNSASGDESGLFLRSPERPDAQPMPGTEGGVDPAFSPDGTWVVFATTNDLRKVPTGGGPVVTLTRGASPISPHWGSDGNIVFWASGGLFRVPEVGGDAEPILEGQRAFSLRFPRLLPEGVGVVFTSFEATGSGGQINLLDPETGEVSTLVEEGVDARWSPTGHLLYGHPSGSVFAVPFDLDDRSVSGPPVPVLDSVAILIAGTTMFRVSETGSAVYQVGGRGGGGAFAFVLQAWDGSRTELPLEPSDHFDARLSPDGGSIAYIREDHVYVYDIDRGTNTRLTFEGTFHHDPVWSPDGATIAFTTIRADSTGADIYTKRVDGTQPAERVGGLEGIDYSRGWSSDGRWLIVDNLHTSRGSDIYLIDTESGSQTPYLQADWNEAVPAISPDGRWAAYMSDEGGQNEVYVRPFPDPTGKWQISEDGGAAPFWAPDGRTVYYRSGGGVMAADVTTDPSFAILRRRQVGNAAGPVGNLTPDGAHMLVGLSPGNTADESGSTVHHYVVTNWFAELRRRLGQGN